MLRIITATALALLGTSALANPSVGGAPMFAEKNIIENAVTSPIHTTLVAAVQAAGLVETLSGPGPFTVFAPTDEAFARLPAGSVEQLLMPENLGRLQQILACHVMPTEVFSDAIGSMIAGSGGAQQIETLGGCTFTARMRDGMIVIEDGQGQIATVTVADVDQSNGVIHVIDRVLLPARS